MKRLAGKVAFITGGGTWIGRAIAKRFVKEGAVVIIAGHSVCALEGEQYQCTPLDVRDPHALNEAVQAVFAKQGKIDILVSNAGIYPMQPLEGMTEEAFREVLDVNLTGSFLSLQAALPALKQSSAGRVIFMSSISGSTKGFAGFAHYTASKAGMDGLMRTAAIELAVHHITVNSICPGNILNPTQTPASDAEIKEMLRDIPLGRLGTPEDVANLALFLASDESSFITGQCFVIDGGEVVQ